MELDFEPLTILWTVVFYAFILFLIWGVKMGFTGMREKIIITICALPLTYLMIVWQKNR